MYNMEEFYIRVMSTAGIVYRENLKDFLKYFFRTSTMYVANSGISRGGGHALESLIDLFDDLRDIFSEYEILRAYLFFHNENRLCFEVPWECLI